jgi:hypothetical protein
MMRPSQTAVLTVSALGVMLAGSSCGSGQEATGELPSYALPAAATGDDPTGPAVRFTNITSQAGVDFVHERGAFGNKWMPETVGSGGGFLDYDGDAWPDLFLVNGAPWPGRDGQRSSSTLKLYRNLQNGRFADVTVAASLDIPLYGMGATFADYDADGDVDVYVTAVGDNKLLRNDNGRFRDVTRAMGVTGNNPDPRVPPAWSTGAVWVDVDRDGWVDLFVCNYVKWTPETDLFTTLDGTTKSYATPQQYQGESCRLYRNWNGGRFEDVTSEAGVEDPNGKSLGVAVTDFDDDGWPDLIVANDTYPNFLYRNNGDGTFTDVAVAVGVAFDEFGRARAGMGVDAADLTGEGRLSIAIGNFSHEPLSLYSEVQGGLFQDRAGAARLTNASLLALTFGVLFVDVDLDGLLDLITANGHIEPTVNAVQRDVTFEQRPQLFRNVGGGRFVDASDEVGEAFQEPIVGRGIAQADLDRDGDLDVLLTVNGGAPRLFRNDLATDGARWVRIELQGMHPNLDALGAVVTAYVGERVVRRMVRTGSSYLAQSDIEAVVIGLGDASQADSIWVRWPTSGRVDRMGAALAGATYIIREAEPRLETTSSDGS